ncbi:MAG: aspartyl/asparaginyl beta-hydroxylase domain-containing protein, partial [Bacteroidetes bacterium]|nr:aspartyl/asparaginyl beta-hydroxylase domain-containing protein [Bacteroidota bacterium]
MIDSHQNLINFFFSMLWSVLEIAFGSLILLILVLYFVEPSLLAIPFSLVLKLFRRNPPIVETDKYFPEHQLFIENWKTIRMELLQVLEIQEKIPQFHEIDKIQRFISATDNVPWRTFVFKAYDNWMEDNCLKAPKTVELIKQIPAIKTAMFSILGPGKQIPPHRGFYKGIYRYHLGLVVPKNGECFIINGGQKYSWKEGEDILFDDTF